MNEDELRDRLLRQNEDFKRLFDEHRRHEKRLEFLRSKPFLTGEEEVEEKELKKRKLALKDQMYRMMSAYRKAV